jgi:hypothetical protein
MRFVFIGAIALLLVAGIYFWNNGQDLNQHNAVTLLDPTGCEFQGSPELDILKEACLYALGINIPALQPQVLKEIFKTVIELDEQSQEEKIYKLFPENYSIQAEVIQYLAVQKAKLGQFNKALTLANTIPILEWKSYTIRKIAVVKAKNGDFEGAYQVAMGIKERTSRANTLREIIFQMIQFRDFSGARKIAESIDEPYRKRRALVEIERSKQRQAGMLENSETNGQGISLPSKINKPMKIATSGEGVPELQSSVENANDLRIAARAQADQGDFSGAYESIGSIKEPFFKSKALVDMASILAKQGDTTRALEVAENIQTLSARAYAFMNIGLAQKKSKNEALGKKSLDQAFSHARQFSNSEIRDDILSEVALAQLEIGDEQGSQHTIDSISDPFQKTYILRKIQHFKKKKRSLLDYERFIATLLSSSSIRAPTKKAKSLRKIAKQWKKLVQEGVSDPNQIGVNPQ